MAAAGALEPVVLIGRMVNDELGDDAQAAFLRLLDEALEVLHRPEIAIDGTVVGDVVAVIAAGRGIERQQPERGDAEVLEITQLLGQTCEIADAVIVAVGKRLHVKLVNDRVLVPERVGIEIGGRQLGSIDGGHQVHGAYPLCARDNARPAVRFPWHKLSWHKTETAPNLALTAARACLITVMPLTWNRRPVSLKGKETLYLSRKPLVESRLRAIGSLWNHSPSDSVGKFYPILLSGQFRDIVNPLPSPAPILVVRKLRAEWISSAKPRISES